MSCALESQSRIAKKQESQAMRGRTRVRRVRLAARRRSLVAGLTKVIAVLLQDLPAGEIEALLAPEELQILMNCQVLERSAEGVVVG
jgi:hypothetical protein